MFFLFLLILVLFVINLFVGSVDIPIDAVCRIILDEIIGDISATDSLPASWRFIIMNSRLPSALTAMLAGAALGVSGLLLQTLFRNPLAGPNILGINSGASLGVALVMLAGGGSMTSFSLVGLDGVLSVTFAAFLGAMVVMAVLLFFSSLLKSDLMLLIAGIMIGYVASGVIALLNFFATAEGVQTYMIWGMGSFSSVDMKLLGMFAALVGIGLLGALLLVKPLNALLLGDNYATNLGVRVSRIRTYLLLIVGLLSAVTTAFCGPVSFLGLAVPHVGRLLFRRSDHRRLLPVTILLGSAMALLCNLLCVLPGDGGVIPLGAVTPLLGAPVVIYVVMLSRRR